MKRAPWCIKDTRTHHILCLRHMSSAELHVAMAALLRAVALHHRAKKRVHLNQIWKSAVRVNQSSLYCVENRPARQRLESVLIVVIKQCRSPKSARALRYGHNLRI